MREKLIELLGKVTCTGNGESLGSCPDRKYGLCGEVANLSYCVIQNIANYLIANGVTVQQWIPASERQRKDPQPLTIEELRQMDGEPVWVHNLEVGKSFWALAYKDVVSNRLGWLDYSGYGKIWVAYRVECWRCHYCGKTKIGKRRAVKAWNKIRRKHHAGKGRRRTP